MKIFSYPLYQKGNPQLRVFLPNFWMKLVKPENPGPKNVVQFHCSMEMTRYDIKNYLEKIYKVPIIKVNTRIALGKTKKNPLGGIVKEEDVKVAYISLVRMIMLQKVLLLLHCNTINLIKNFCY